MGDAEELKKWVRSLTMGEKRFIKLLGNARSRQHGNQQLELMDWLAEAGDNTSLPSDAAFTPNFPMVSVRLKDLILDGLHLLHKESSTDAKLRNMLGAVELLLQKDLLSAATRTLGRAKKLALATSRYVAALQCMHSERLITQKGNPHDIIHTMARIHAQEEQILLQLSEFTRLQHIHEKMYAQANQFLIPRDSETLHLVQGLVNDERITHHSENGNYVEQALAVNILGIKNLFERDQEPAMQRYQALLLLWHNHPEWQIDQPQLLFLICNFYQIACLTSKVEWPKIKESLDLLPDFGRLPSEVRLQFQRSLHLNKLLIAMNLGQLESAMAMIPDIEFWLNLHEASLGDGSVVTFLYNFAVLEFFCAQLVAAHRHLVRLLNMPNLKLREDVREFALVLQAIIQYELGDDRLNEYLVRAGKRHFKSKPRALAFELVVLRYLERAMGIYDPSLLESALDQLIDELDQLVSQVDGSLPIVGLIEVRLWAKAKRLRQPLTVVFQAAVKENLEALG